MVLLGGRIGKPLSIPLVTSFGCWMRKDWGLDSDVTLCSTFIDGKLKGKVVFFCGGGKLCRAGKSMR